MSNRVATVGSFGGLGGSRPEMAFTIARAETLPALISRTRISSQHLTSVLMSIADAQASSGVAGASAVARLGTLRPHADMT